MTAGVEDSGADIAWECVCLGGWWWWGMILGGYWWVYSLLTMLMLVLSIGATDVEVVARATAVRNWSESAARWVVWLWPADV